MTPDDVTPAPGYAYRDLDTGEVVRVLSFDRGRNVVSLASKSGRPRWTTIAGFWSQHVHRDIYDAQRN